MKKTSKKILSALLTIYLGMMILGTLIISSIAISIKNMSLILFVGANYILTGLLSFIALLLLGNFKKINIFMNKNRKQKVRIAWISSILVFLFLGTMPLWAKNVKSTEVGDEANSFIKVNDNETLNEKEVAETDENKELDKKEEENNEEQAINSTPEFKSAIGNLYTGVTLYAEENGQMEPYFTVVDKGEDVSNTGGEIIKNGVLVKEISSGDTYWKDVDRMIKDSKSDKSYIIKYYVKSDDPYLP